MSTNSTLSILNKDGSLESIYCHSDGYLSWNGEILYNSYKDIEKIRKMINIR